MRVFVGNRGKENDFLFSTAEMRSFASFPRQINDYSYEPLFLSERSFHPIRVVVNVTKME